MDISAALDFSTANAALAVGKSNSEKILFTAKKAMTGRDASSMLPWIISQLNEHGVTLDDIKQWTCGTGPGSFTGLRIIASLVAGLTYGKVNIQVRGVPSGTAIAEAISYSKPRTAVLYDGKRQELICFTNKNEPMIAISNDNVNQLEKFEIICAMHSEKTAIEKIVPPALLEQVQFLSEFPIEKLLLNKTCQWQKNNQGGSLFEPDLVYIRPAV